ncbi:hypothetical protein BDR07DRAFT_1382249 [Suillus spraguei]|nr:hypothetical protein BDR07DRAFT_1382249 [Suillus spraguei]
MFAINDKVSDPVIDCTEDLDNNNTNNEAPVEHIAGHDMPQATKYGPEYGKIDTLQILTPNSDITGTGTEALPGPGGLEEVGHVLRTRVASPATVQRHLTVYWEEQDSALRDASRKVSRIETKAKKCLDLETIQTTKFGGLSEWKSR